jgi:hypothetical protein
MEDLTKRKESHFQAFKMTNSCSSEAMYSSAKSLMTLAESQCQVTKTPNRGFVDARYLWVEGHMTIEESHSLGRQNAKQRLC